MEQLKHETFHILVVDDEPDVESLICQKFRREIRSDRYRFTFASDGVEAFEKAIAAPDVDIVLTDINMPKMDGLTLISKLNALENPPKIVVVSAYGDMENIRAAMNNGAFDFITKPISFKDLVATLEKTLAAISKEKAYQLQLNQAKVQMVQSEKMASLGQMVAGVAHEINNPVNFIYGNLKPAESYIQDLITLIERYQNAYPDPVPEVQSCIEDIDLNFLKSDLNKLFESLDIGARRIRDLVLSLRNFSRLDESEKKTVDIHEGIDSTLLLLANRLKATAQRPDIQIIKSYDSASALECYPSQLNQVVMNLLANAIDALEERSQNYYFQDLVTSPNVIQICTQQILSAASETDWVSITIADNGPGMKPETLSKLFDPFFTTKPVGKGTGLGLSISYQIIVEKHGGRLSCQSAVGEGTKFTIELPVSTARKQVAMQHAAA